MAKRAVFLDRDGTIVEDPGFLHEPDQVKLLPGAAEAIKRLNDRGFLIVVISNQSGIARGLYTAQDYAAVQRRLGELLKQHRAYIDASYFCPHHPSFPGSAGAAGGAGGAGGVGAAGGIGAEGGCECRKPAHKLFLDAQKALDIDFPSSWWVGDRLSDVQPARTLGGGGHGILVATGEGNLHQGQARALGVTVVADLASAVDEILQLSR